MVKKITNSKKIPAKTKEFFDANKIGKLILNLDVIEDEIAEVKSALDKKSDKKDLDVIEKRVLRLELELNECKKQIAAAKAKS